MPILVYTDGSCLGNPGPGGYAALIINPDGSARQLVGTERRTTNGRMELMAVVVALEYFREPSELRVHSDSQFVTRGASEWLEGWKARGWRKANNKPVEHIDLWQRIDAQMGRHDVELVWVRGHNGDRFNELADRLAKEAARNALGATHRVRCVPILIWGHRAKAL